MGDGPQLTTGSPLSERYRPLSPVAAATHMVLKPCRAFSEAGTKLVSFLQ